MLSLSELLNVEQKAEWRSRLADCYPDDRRNAAASELLSRFAGELATFDGGSLYYRIARYAADEEFSMSVGFVLKAVGFRFRPKTCEELLIEVAQQLERDCRSEKHLQAV